MQDQQLGGLIMWVPAGLVYAFAGLALFAGWLRESETRARQRESQTSDRFNLPIPRPLRPSPPPV